MLCYPEEFSYKEPPYEYEFERLPMDLILGDMALRKGLERGEAIMDLEKKWKPALDEFKEKRQKYLLYEE
jgi:uncharacterized protein YbbC (DUF1343 family)